MKKILVIAVAIMLVMAVFAGCSSNGDTGAADAAEGDGAQSAEVSGETFDGGNISVLVPDGWMAFHGVDYFEDYDEGYDPNVVNVVKDGEDEFSMFTNPYIQIYYYGADSDMYVAKELYEDAEDIDPITLGNYTWEGFTAESLDMPFTLLYTEDGDDQFQVTIWTKTDEGEISLDDADAQAIIASIAAK